jgi:hypothetical protein
MLPFAASADETFRCGNSLVTSELSVDELLQKCGEPASRTSTTEDVQARNQYGLMIKVGETVRETWTYDRGINPAMVVTIVDGSIKSIERQE